MYFTGFAEFIFSPSVFLGLYRGCLFAECFLGVLPSVVSLPSVFSGTLAKSNLYRVPVILHSANVRPLGNIVFSGSESTKYAKLS